MSKPEVTNEKKRRNEGANKGRFASRMIVIVPVAIVLLLTIVGTMYYKPLSIWYRETRQLRVLHEQRIAIKEYNEELHESLKSLETTEGIRAFAREELGLVEEGESAVIVMKDGKPLERAHDTKQTDILNIPITSQPFGAWTPFLDTFFKIELPK